MPKKENNNNSSFEIQLSKAKEIVEN